MDNRALVEAYRDTQQRLLGLMDFLSALQDLSSLDLATPELGTLLNGGLRALLENQGMERCSVFLQQDGCLVNAAGMDWADLMGGNEPAQQCSVACLKVGEGIMGLAAAHGEIQRCDDCRTDPRFASLGESVPVGSLICLPIRQDGSEVLGVLNVSHPEPGYFNVERLRLLRLFTEFLGQSVTHWRHVHRMEELIARRTSELERALAQARELQERYEALAVVDDLTGLNNRRFFFPEAQAALARAMRHAQPFSVLALDLDHFKRVNDDHGHAWGDRVLKDVGAGLKEMLREGDILARFGGEEFVFALPGTDRNGALSLAERIRQRLAQLSWNVGDRCLMITASMGVSGLAPGEAPRGTTQAMLDRLVAQADQALYGSKNDGRDRVTLDRG
jgi:diguanylate cyclase (GGDEF)-like protein